MSDSINEIQSKMASKLGWEDFEHFVADLWELQGYSTEVTGHHDKEGEDVIATQTVPFKIEIILQAKRIQLEDTVGKDVAQIHALDDGADADLSVIVTTSSFTRGAINYVNLRKSTKLANGKSLAKLVKKFNAEELLDDYVEADNPEQLNVEQYRDWTKYSGELRDIRGIGNKFEKRLAEAGIYTISDLAEIDPKSIAKGTDITEGRLKQWVTEAAYQEGKTDVVRRYVPKNELQTIDGIGPEFEKRLKKVGIETTIDLAVSNYKEIAQKDDFSKATIRDWGRKACYQAC